MIQKCPNGKMLGRVARRAPVTQEKETNRNAHSAPVLKAGRNHTESERTEEASSTSAEHSRRAGGSNGPIPASLAPIAYPLPTPQHAIRKEKMYISIFHFLITVLPSSPFPFSSLRKNVLCYFNFDER